VTLLTDQTLGCWHPEIAAPGLALPQHLAVLGTWIREMNEGQERA
jgi:hypothetical protein